MAISLKELSRILGLSQTTVSRALNGYPEVSETTRKRVEEAAKLYSYQPNPRARGLATGRSMMIGHVLPQSSTTEVVNPVFYDFLSGAGQVYAQRGYSAHLSFPPATHEADHYRFLARQRMVDAVILHLPRPNDDRLQILEDIRMVYGVHGQLTHSEDTYNFVGLDNVQALRLATEHLVDLGHERIALINGPAGTVFAARREEGFLQVMEASGLVANRLWMLNADMTESYGYTAARKLLASDSAPTAFLTGSIIVASGVFRAAMEHNLRVPDQLSIVTHDDVLSCHPNDGAPPRFTATRSSVSDAGRLLAQIVLDQIERPDSGPKARVLHPALVQGLSSGPAPNHASRQGLLGAPLA